VHNFPRGEITQKEALYVLTSVTPREIELILPHSLSGRQNPEIADAGDESDTSEDQ
jgi:hypothetical protein